MFSKKAHADLKKSTLKVLDTKKDTSTRLKHLRVVLDTADLPEIKAFFDGNYSSIYFIFYDQFINIEGNLKQRAHKSHREELEAALVIFEKFFLLLPELVSKKWQCHSIGRLMKKLLHPGNSLKLRKEAVRLFLIWYQILGEGAPLEVHLLFSCLVPGIGVTLENGEYITLERLVEGSAPGFLKWQHSPEVNSSAACPVEIAPILPAAVGEKQPEDLPKFFLDVLLNSMVTQVSRIEWRDKNAGRHQRCFNFLFEKFKKSYLLNIFPDFCWKTSLYKPVLELPERRKIKSNHVSKIASTDSKLSSASQHHCKVVIINWVAKFTHRVKRRDVRTPRPSVVPQTEEGEVGGENRGVPGAAHNESMLERYQSSVLTSSTYTEKESEHSCSSFEDLLATENSLVCDTFYSSRENVNFVHEVFRQAFLLTFNEAATMRSVIAVYRDWINTNATELPAFMLEPGDPLLGVSKEAHPHTATHAESSDYSVNQQETGHQVQSQHRVLRLRNDSYLGAIYREHMHIRAGLQSTLKVFITNAANVFLLEVQPEDTSSLDEQVDMCKRVLNLYRYIVVNTSMDQKTWEQLLLVLMQITSLTLDETPPLKKECSLGGRLAQALFQTLIVTWIKASLIVVIYTELWDQFLQVLSTLTRWEELIKEWAKTMETLTRVMVRLVYNLDLNNLPLDRLSEQKQKRRKGRLQPSDPQSQTVSTQGSMASTVTQPTLNSPSSSQPTSLKCTEKEGNSAANRSKETSHRMHTILFNSAENDAPESDDWQSIPCRKRSRSGDECPRIPQSTVSADATESSVVRSKSESNIPAWSDTTSIRSSRGSSTAPPDDVFHGAEDAKGMHRRSKSLDYLRFMRASSPSSVSESSVENTSRSPSPTHSAGVESNSIKESPMQIDVISGENPCPGDMWDEEKGEHLSVLAGGTSQGWFPDVSVALWRRMLGALGDVNEIRGPDMHAQVFEYLIDLWETLVKIRENLGVTVDNHSSPPPPTLVPPIDIFAAWLFKAISLPDKFIKGKLLAYRLLCCSLVQRHDIALSKYVLVHYYRMLHMAIVGEDQEVINTVTKYCGPRMFSSGLPGATLLLLDFISAANSIITTPIIKGFPRTEAVTTVGSLVCFPNMYGEISVLQPRCAEFVLRNCRDAKDQVIDVLLTAGRKEPAGLARCIALCSIGIFLYEELVHKTKHPKTLEAINVLLAALRQSAPGTDKWGILLEFSNKLIGQVACDMLLMLSDHIDVLMILFPDAPIKIVTVLATTLENLLPTRNSHTSEGDKKLLLSLLFCLGEWCMKVPLDVLVDKSRHKGSMLMTVFRVLNVAVTGVWSFTSEAPTLAELNNSDFDMTIQLDNINEGISSGSPVSPRSHMESPLNASSNGKSTNVSGTRGGVGIVRLAARTVMNHIVNHLNHFPMSIGASRLTSMVNEHDDIPGLSCDEMSTEIFQSPNVQFFVLNNATLISLVELPALEVPGGGVTAGLSTAKSQVRVILRDLSGKFSWDCSVIYGPSHQQDTQFPISAWDMISHESIQDMEDSALLNSFSFQSTPGATPPFTLRRRNPDILPTFEDSAEDLDNLDDILQYIGFTSPECLSSSGQPLNIPYYPPQGLRREVEEEAMTAILNQRNYERDHVQRHNFDGGVVGRPIYPTQSCEPESPFQLCRQILNQLGLMSWEKRTQFDLLKKNEKLLRELRNLDSQKSRETHKIAVIYVAEGQEDKNSVLLNHGGSQAYEEFIAGLAWEVELETHGGFMGGLQRNKSTGDTAPYYATSFKEVIFHVATRMRTTSEESKLQKLRHLGNDEVHIVWSEHSREYRRGIIATEFCDVLIVIYPLPNRLYRIQISRKPEVPYFGPLFNGAIVDHKILPGLVRATAINASCAKRSTMPYFQNFYEERAKAFDAVVNNHKELTTFENFTANVFMPSAPTKSFSNCSNGLSFGKEDSAAVLNFSELAAALLDSHTSTGSSGVTRAGRPISLSSSEQSSPAANLYINFKGPQPKTNDPLESSNPDDIVDVRNPTSPKAPKRLSFKGNVRKGQAVSMPKSVLASTPPESPPTKSKK